MASRPPEGPMEPAAPTDRERSRWMVLNMMRALGFALAIFGIVLTQGGVRLGTSIDEKLGYFLIVVGLIDGFVVPQVLARKWRSPKA